VVLWLEYLVTHVRDLIKGSLAPSPRHRAWSWIWHNFALVKFHLANMAEKPRVPRPSGFPVNDLPNDILYLLLSHVSLNCCHVMPTSLTVQKSSKLFLVRASSVQLLFAKYGTPFAGVSSIKSFTWRWVLVLMKRMNVSFNAWAMMLR